MLLVNIDSISNKEVEELGIVKGSVVRTKHIGKDVMAGFKTLVGGEIASYTEMMGEARSIATSRMIKEAQSLNADAIVGVRYTSAAVMGGAAEIMAYGTAVKYK
jgi:uncharacterized protein YbjQ (UPF0145 family)